MIEFERDGYLIRERLIPLDRCRELVERADELVARAAPAAGGTVFRADGSSRDADFLASAERIRAFLEADALDEQGRLVVPPDRAVNKLGHALHDLDPTFDAFSRAPEMVELCRRLGCDRFGLLQSMLIFKHPRVGGEVDLHQDASFLFTEPDSVIGLWVALEDADATNGCLRVVPGGHRGPVRRRLHRRGDHTEMTILDDQPIEGTELALEVPAGTVVALHGRLPHRSDANRSERSRRAYTLHLIDTSLPYPETNWLKRCELPLRDVHGRPCGG